MNNNIIENIRWDDSWILIIAIELTSIDPLGIVHRNKPIHQSFMRERRYNLWWIDSASRLGISITVKSQVSALETIMFSRVWYS